MSLKINVSLQASYKQAPSHPARLPWSLACKCSLSQATGLSIGATFKNPITKLAQSLPIKHSNTETLLPSQCNELPESTPRSGTCFSLITAQVICYSSSGCCMGSESNWLDVAWSWTSLDSIDERQCIFWSLFCSNYLCCLQAGKCLYTTIRELVENALDSAESISELPLIEIEMWVFVSLFRAEVLDSGD